jgi:hypothetical protein
MGIKLDHFDPLPGRIPPVKVVIQNRGVTIRRLLPRVKI